MSPETGLAASGRPELLRAVSDYPGGRELLELASGRDDVALVGGAVRDLLLGRRPRELDVVVARGAAELARELASRLVVLAGQNPDERLELTFHERFRTALVRWSGGQIDVATRRAESYPAPGALPEVREGTIEEDLCRRDFTVNAIAVSLGGPHEGELMGAEHALEDLQAGRMRVLHERSFIDDPTRLLRLARYRARLSFEPERHTAELAAAAVGAGALRTVSGARIGAELRLALGEADGTAALLAMEGMGVLSTLSPRLRYEGPLARAALELLSAADGSQRNDTRRDLLLLAALLQPMVYGLEEGAEEGAEEAAAALLDDLEFPAAERDLVLQAATCADAVAEGLARAETPSEIGQAAAHVSPEGIALAGAWGGLQGVGLGQAARAAREWLADLHNVSLLITGEDLIAAGIPQGPEIGRRLAAALARKLDGELADGREAELGAALEAGA
jgi:tRNA nucleotidyltransferase (CCA-adding enzyme)